MGFYVLSDGNGSFIRRDFASGKYVPVRSFRQAYKWETESKALSVLRNSVSKSIRGDYSARRYVNGEDVSETIRSDGAEAPAPSAETPDVSDWMSGISRLIDMISASEQRISDLSEKVSEVDKEIVDVEHYIELGQFNCYQGWLCFKLLQDRLRQRRKYKDEMQLLSLIRQSGADAESLSTLSRKISALRNKRYSPRAMPELFVKK